MHGLENFVNDCLGLERRAGKLSGFEYVADLLEAAYAKSYVETVGEHADSLHLAITSTTADKIADAYLVRAANVGRRCELSSKEVVLAFDHTDEDYYGQLRSPYLHAWTGENAVTGKWKFLTASIINRDTPPRVPILSIPTPIGYDVSRQVRFMVERIQPLVGKIRIALFDRGFYNLDLIRTLDDVHVPYLIFAPRTAKTGREFATMKPGERKTIHHEFEVRKGNTREPGQTTLALLKQIYSPRRKTNFDWVFATSDVDVDLETVIQKYTARWRIETGFRVQDQAHVMSRSQEALVRYFHFAFEQALQFSWAALYKEEAPYTRFLQQLRQASHDRVHNADGKRARIVGTGS